MTSVLTNAFCVTALWIKTVPSVQIFLEEESHFLFCCPVYDDARRKYLSHIIVPSPLSLSDWFSVQNTKMRHGLSPSLELKQHGHSAHSLFCTIPLELLFTHALVRARKQAHTLLLNIHWKILLKCANQFRHGIKIQPLIRTHTHAFTPFSHIHTHIITPPHTHTHTHTHPPAHAHTHTQLTPLLFN